MIKNVLLCAALLTGIAATAQVRYGATTDEYIFSLGQTQANDSVAIQNVVRFSGFFNYGYQHHFDFNKNIGVFTGLHIRNVGLINRMDTLRIKHRAYALGVPLAIKIGNTSSKWFVAPGAEAELMLNYKVKEFVRGKKINKYNEWLSNDVTLFNPSVFLQVNMGNAGNLKFKYYLYDFLTPVDPETGYRVAMIGSKPIPGYTQESKLFYVSYGNTITHKKRGRRPVPSATPQNSSNRRRDA